MRLERDSEPVCREDQNAPDTFDVVVVGGGPAGATAATDLARIGWHVLLLDKAGRIKPCGGAIPPRLIRDFEIPDRLLVAKITSARMISPSDAKVDMPIDGGFVGMVDRKDFDPWLRERAREFGVVCRDAIVTDVQVTGGEFATITYRDQGPVGEGGPADGDNSRVVRARMVIGADGANSMVARATMPKSERVPFVFAYHEIVESPRSESATANEPAGDAPEFERTRCDVYYQGKLSPDFYAWVFPHGETASIGVGSAQKGFSLRGAVGELRRSSHLDGMKTIRTEGAPIPLRPLKRWDNGRNVLLTGDAAGVVAPASGEGIYYAMLSGRLAADAVSEALAKGDARCLAGARQRFMREHGRVFWILGLLQYFWYSNDRRRERFVSMCRDPDVQRLTWQSYMNKKLVRRDPLAHVRVFFKDLAHLCGLVAPR